MTFVFRDDGYFNMTKAAKAFGKQLQHFWNAEETRGYVVALADSQNPNHRKPMNYKADYGEVYLAAMQAVAAIQRGRYGGTWGHPKLAVFFARWLDVRFAVFCDMAIDDILRGNAELVITKPAQSAVAAAPQSYLESVEQRLVSLRENEALSGIISVKGLTAQFGCGKSRDLGNCDARWTTFGLESRQRGHSTKSEGHTA